MSIILQNATAVPLGPSYRAGLEEALDEKL